MTVFVDSDYYVDYNNLLSEAGNEFANIKRYSSPTLSKQESITGLYDSICSERPGKISGLIFQGLKFPALFLAKFLFYLYVSIRCNNSKNKLHNCIFFRTWLEPRCCGESHVKDVHFAALPEDCSSFASVVSSFSAYNFKSLKKFMRGRSPSQIVHEGWLTPFDVVILFCTYFKYAYLRVKGSYYYKNKSIGKYINRSLLSDFFKLRNMAALAEAKIFENIRNLRLRSVVYVFENQSWEKMLCYTMKDKGIPLIGIQGSGFSPVFLNFFPTSADSAQPVWPSVVYTVGDNFARSLTQYGNYKIPVQTFGALRFPYDHDGAVYKVANPNPIVIGRILYALPVHLGQYPRIINDLTAVFGGSEVGVDLKYHPHYIVADLEKTFRLPENFRWVADVPKQLLNEYYDVVIFNDNSFGIESLFCGVKCFEYDLGLPVPDTRLIYFDEWDPSINFDDLSDIRDSILDRTIDKSYNVKSIEKYMNMMYRPYIDQFNMIKKLLEHNHEIH